MNRRTISYWTALLALTIVIAHQLATHRTHALTFTVTTTSDNGNNAAPTAGSLRKAILDANANAGLDSIQFNIPGGGIKTINPPATLPTITSAVIIDGYTQPGSSVNTGTTSFNATINIRLDGNSSNVNGLFLGAGSSGSTIKGLTIIQFSGHGIRIDSSGNRVQGCAIGTTGFTDEGNLSNGVIVNTTDNNIIGTDANGANDLAEKNVISGNDASGVEIFGATASGNIIKGNFIGAPFSGPNDLGNTADGIEIELAVNTTIGGTTANERNVISGNNSQGIEIHGSGATGNVIQGNFIGTSSAGTADLGNSSLGVYLNDVAANTVGGETATPGTGAGNVISGNSGGVQISGSAATGNTVAGNIIGLDSAGAVDLGNGSGVRIVDANSNTIGGTTTTARNIISANDQTGVYLSNADSNLIKANYIGTNAAGTGGGFLTNQTGVELDLGSSNNTIGGTTVAERNVISGNLGGVKITDSPGNFLYGNYIGVTAAGGGGGGNSAFSVRIDNGVSNRIGDTTAGAGNVITGNPNAVEIINTSSTFATRIRIQGNIIGLDATGTVDHGGPGDGIHITDSNNVQIGGAVTNARNIISGFGEEGIQILGTSTATLIQGNYIGTDITGSLSRGNAGGGVRIETSNNTIGGAGNARNVISGNGAGGILLFNASGILVQNNLIGTDANGTNPIPNSSLGVNITSSSNNTIGGAAGLGNIIAFNGADGVRAAGTANGNAILGNSIFSNGSTSSDLGIDLVGTDGVTPNDNDDPDTGANNLQNFPVLTSAENNASTTTVSGTFNSTPNTAFTIDFFANTVCDGLGNGEGQTFLGSISLATAADGNAGINFTHSPAVPPGHFITATATRFLAPRDTSEFSACQVVTNPTDVALIDFAANALDRGTLIEWQTGMEVNNLGFNLYRDEGGKRERVNPRILAGSALVAGSVTLRAGRSYAWFDEYHADKESAYWLEDIDINGKSTWHGPFLPTPGSEKPAGIQQAKTLAALAVNESPSVPAESLARLPGSSAPYGALKLSAMAPTPEPGTSTKLAIKREGWYRLTQAELIAAGFNASIDPRLLQLFVDGKQQAIVVNGQDDGSFDQSDSVEFYATGIDSPFSEARTYYLRAGKQTGRRVSQIESFAPRQHGGSFAYTVERRERTIYFSALRNGERENFFGSVIASQPVNQSLTLQHVDFSSNLPALLKVVLQGVTNIDHVVTIEVNGSFAGTLRFPAQASGDTTLELPHSMLQEGANVVRLSPQGGPSDVSLVDSVRLTYQHAFAAENDLLRFTVAAGQPVTIEGFSDPAIRILDVTDPYAVKEINGTIEKREDKQLGLTASITFTAPGNGQRTLLALTDALAKRPDKVVADNPSNVRGTFQNAALVIVTSREFFEQAGSLRSYRQSQGLSAAVVDIEDIYDEFSFGQKCPHAVRDFLSFVNRNWRSRYALLLGDSSFDSKNYLGLGDSDLVPTRLLDTYFMETASDDWLADFDQNGIADFAIGRIPARTTSEAETMIGKIYSYERSKSSNEALLVSDLNDGFDFEQANARLIPLLPQGTSAIHVKRAQLGDSATKAAVVDGINRGQRVVSYAGHGSANVWRGNSLTATDAKLLKNSHQFTTFVIMNCLNGYFTDPATESLSEALMRNADGGAVAAWASSAMTFADGQASLSQEFYRQMFGNGARLGDAAIRAKATTLDADVRRTWILFGDPSMRLLK